MGKNDQQLSEAIRRTQSSLANPTKGIRGADLLSPLFEHALTAAFFLAVGYWIFRTYDESVVGFVGVVMMLWGGLFKGIILFGIYGFALFALLFKRDWFAHVAERNHIRKVESRITKDLEEEREASADDRLHGLLCAYPDNMHLRRSLAARMIKRDELIAAGKLLALHPSPTRIELAAIHMFCKSNGHDPFQIMRKAIKGVGGPHLSTESRLKLHDLHRAITREADKNAWQWRAVDQYLNNTLLKTKWRYLVDDYRHSMLELLIAAAIFVVLWAAA
ncbi:MAG: hypothetical protein H6876_04560 [Hyphomicrobiaceae bacterium]|nr:hypothetical protein [Hyphomicrobiaceae bacterium]MCC0007379.1 hypothetical protein [Hyphomicrobiaceae bacterium]